MSNRCRGTLLLMHTVYKQKMTLINIYSYLRTRSPLTSELTDIFTISHSTEVRNTSVLLSADKGDKFEPMNDAEMCIMSFRSEWQRCFRRIYYHVWEFPQKCNDLFFSNGTGIIYFQCQLGHRKVFRSPVGVDFFLQMSSFMVRWSHRYTV